MEDTEDRNNVEGCVVNTANPFEHEPDELPEGYVETEDRNEVTSYVVNTTDSFEHDLDELLDGYRPEKAIDVFDQITKQSKTLDKMPCRHRVRDGKTYREMPVGNYRVAYNVDETNRVVELIGIRHTSQNR